MAPRPEQDALDLEAARRLLRELETPSFSLDIGEAHGCWEIEFGREASRSLDSLHPTKESKLRRYLMARRGVPSDALISQEEANRIAAEHPGPIRVQVTESSLTEQGKCLWRYRLRSPVTDCSSGMGATDALGWSYQLDQWASETEQELASQPSINTAMSQACAFWRRALGVSGYVEVELEELDSTHWKVVWPNGQEEAFDRPRSLETGCACCWKRPERPDRRRKLGPSRHSRLRGAAAAAR